MPSRPTHAQAFMPYPEVAVPYAAHGPLSGLSFGVKDLFDVAGYPTSGGQPFMLALSGIKQRHAKVVQQLLDNGAKFAGKTITDEQLIALLEEVKKVDRDIPVLIKADETTQLKKLAFVMDACRKTGLNKFSLQSR